MIKNFELFENLNNAPQIGDYIIVNDPYSYVNKFTNNNIGRLIYIETGVGYPYKVKYEGIPKSYKDYLQNNKRLYTRDEIIFFSKNIEDCKMYLQSKKYNL